MRITTLYSILFLFVCQLTCLAQTPPLLTGRIIDGETGKSLPYANLTIKGTIASTQADKDGAFRWVTKKTPPFTLIVSAVGYQTQEQAITSIQPLALSLSPQPIIMDVVVVTASRVAEKSLQSPITIEQLDHRALQETPSPTFFDALENVKGVQMTTASLGFKVPNTRGFTNPTNVRFLQLVDGVDNQAPVIGASIANAAGPTELDIDHAEVIPGAASALYGMNSLNGLVNFFTKSPFDHQGLSLYQRIGVNHIHDPETTSHLLGETAIRYAKAFHDRFAFKVNLAYFKGYDWIANQSMDLNSQANASVNLLGDQNPAFDPVSSYGNESPNRRTLSMNGKNYVVARTGYYEKDITDYRLENLKADVALHYKLSSQLEASYTYRMGKLDNVYQRTNRFKLDDYLVQQHVIQLKSPVFNWKAYYSQEESGQSYNIRSLAENLDKSFKSDDNWFKDYSAKFQKSTQAGIPVDESLQIARTFADAGQFQPGTARYDSAVAQIIAINNWDVGSALRTKASIFHTEGQYDFSSKIKIFHLLAGFDYRMYSVLPDGNYFINPVESGKNLLYRKGGAFIQLSKKLLHEKLQVNLALRYDKNEYFSGLWNPRVSAVYTWKENQNFRLSYQNGYRFPSLFEAFSNVNSGGVKRVGGLPVMSHGIFEDSYIRTSIDAFQAAVNKAVNQQQVPLAEAITQNSHLLKKSAYNYIQPERINSLEAGYKSLLLHKRLFIDVDFYFNFYNNFIAQVEVNQTVKQGLVADSIAFYLYDKKKQNRYRLWTNSTSTVYNYGSSLGLKYNLYKGFTLAGNASYAKLSRKQSNDGLEESFNTPQWITNISLGNQEVIKNVGFNLTWHWQDTFLWQSSLGTGMVPAYHNLDAQVSLKVPQAKLLLKVGGSNVLNHRYYQMIAGPTIGAMYYLTVVFDDLLR
ncbi:MAG: TonB-dependent receptor [Bacteroidota bacterium]